jgi:CRP/FNR family transcriptional regulator, cyclic AMP receptor protein
MKKVLFILGELDDDDFDWMLEVSDRRQVGIDEVLIEEGDAIPALYLLLDGELVVVQGDRELAVLYPGDIVGEMSFIDSRPPSATVRANRPSRVLQIPSGLLMAKLLQDVGFASRFYQAMATLLSTRLRLTMRQFNQDDQDLQACDLPDYELDRLARDKASLAQIRLDWLLRRFRNDGSYAA